MSFILGGSPVSQNKWMITALSEKPTYWKQRGKMHIVTVSITLKEYRVDENVTAGTQKSTPWGDVKAQIGEYREQAEAYKQEALDVLDRVDDEVGDLL